MTTRKYSSRSQQTTLSSAIGSADTTMTVGSATTILGGITISAGETFTLVINPDTALEEIVDVYSPSANPVSSNTLTIVRGRDGSTAQEHSAGAVVRHMAIGRDYREANAHIEETTTAHGVTFANLIKTTDTGTVTSTMIANGTIATGDIADSAISTAKIADSAITSAKIADLTIASGDIADSAITSGKIATGAVGTAKIDDLSVTEGKLAPTAVTAAKIATDAVTTAKIQDGAVTSGKIADGTIVNADVSATAAIAKTKLDLGGTITSADLVDGTIVNADINASAAIALSKLAVDPLARDNHTGSQTASTISDFDTQVRTNRLDQMAAPTGSVSANSQKITNLATPTSSGDAVSLGYINGQLGTANGIAPLDGTGKVPTDHLPALAISETSVVNSQANMLALSAQVGDIAVRTDVNKSFILTATPASTLANWQELLTPTDAVLSVDGTTGAVSLSGTYLNRTSGQLLGNLDANTYKVTNLGTPTSNADAATKAYVDTVAGSATAAAASAAAAATTYDNFDDRYLGAKSTAPTVDNDGNTLLVGAIYWNSVANAMYAWTGTEWGSISSTADIFRYRYTASGGETSESGPDDNGLTLSYIPGKEQVYLNGVLLLRTTDYNATNGSSITGLSALAAGDILEVITFTAFELANVLEPTLFDAKGDLLAGTGADTVGKLTVGSNGTVLVADSSTATGLKWSAYDPLPSQTGNSGKYLTTNGTATSWGTVESLGAKSISVAAGLGKGPYTYTNTFGAGGYFISQGNDSGAGSLTIGSITNTASTKGAVLSTSTTGATVDLSSLVRWSTGTVLTDNATHNFLAYGNGVFVTGSSNDRVRTSTDGITWTGRTLPVSGYDYFAGAYLSTVSQKYVVGGGAGNLLSSTDGTTWTSRTSQFGTSRINKIIAGNGIYLACGFSGKLSTSTDGITWTARSTGTMARLTTLMYAPDKTEKYVVMGGSTATITSTDGTTWVERTGPSMGGAAIEKGAYGNGVYLGAASAGSQFGYSTNGTTWSVVTRPSSNLEPTTLDFVNGYFIYGTSIDSSFNSLSRFYISTDALTWTDISTNVNSNAYMTQFVYASDKSPSKVFAIGDSGFVRMSPDFYGILASSWSANIIGPMTNTALT